MRFGVKHFYAATHRSVTPSKLLNISEPQLPDLYNGGDISPNLPHGV